MDSNQSSRDRIRAGFLYRIDPLRRVKCDVEDCDYACVRLSQLRSHKLISHECSNCGGTFPNRRLHEPCNAPPSRRRMQVGGAAEDGPFELIDRAHHDRVIVYRNHQLDGTTDLNILFENVRPSAFRLISNILHIRKGMQITFTTQVRLERDGAYKDPYLASPNMTLTHPNFIDTIYTTALLQQQRVLEMWTEEGSGWRVKEFLCFEISFGVYNPTGGGGYIETPKGVGTKGIINIKNKDNYCFLYCIYAHLFPVEGDMRAKTNPNKYLEMLMSPDRKYHLDYTMLQFPVPIQDFSPFETANKVSINVYGYNSEKGKKNADKGIKVIYPMILTKQTNVPRKRHINLLFLENSISSHYVLISNLSAFMGNGERKYDLCRFCLNKYIITNTEEDPVTGNIVNRTVEEPNYVVLDAHEAACRTVKGPRIIFAKDDKNIKFNDLKQTFAVPYICFADLEAFMTRINRIGTDQHDPSSYAYIVCSDEAVESFRLYDNVDPIKDLIEHLLMEADEHLKRICNFTPIVPLSDEEFLDNYNSVKCNFCKEYYTDKNKKVMHHAHVDCIYLGKSYKAGQYICTLCNNCNMQIKFKKQLYCLFHNGQKYDMKMLVQALTVEYKDRVDILAKTKENFISITIDKKLRITDSIQHLRGALGGLVDSLAKAGLEKFSCTSFMFSDFHHILPKLISKQPFPYSYCRGKEVWEETSLPPKQAFFNDLKDEPISDEDYNHALDIWKETGCKTFRDYCKLYLTLDVTLLADVYLDYRSNCMKNLIIDPTYSITSSGYSFRAFLYMSKVEIECIRDMEMYILLKKGLKGGITQAATRYVKTNLPEVEGYDPCKPKSEVMFTDCNAMYPSAMMQPMPISGFRMLTADELNSFNVMDIDDSLGKGYIIECDVEYPDALHTAHAMFPMMPEKYTIRYMELSDYQFRLLHSLNQWNVAAAEKLLLTLFDKDNYISYHKLLRFYISKGITVKKYHRVMEFNEKAYMADYVVKLSELRKNAVSDISAMYYKIILNSIYGYCLRNTANDIDCSLCFDGETCERYLARHNYHSYTIIHEDLSVFQFKKNTVKFSQPYATGFCITELARLELYSFYYDVLSPHFNNRLTVCMMDTDSVMVNIELKDKTLTEELAGISQHFDFSNLNEGSPHIALKSDINKGVPGKWKLEKDGRRIREACALKVKQYSILLDNECEVVKGKGIPRPVLKRLRHGMYLDVLKGGEIVKRSAKHIVSRRLKLFTVAIEKLSLHAFTASRYILDDGINTLPFGHKDIREAPHLNM